ncbi:MAG: hypothetical protein IJ225_05560 [Solobacterium sp.]|nr:hypothetical protein [Solobacterium sp.]
MSRSDWKTMILGMVQAVVKLVLLGAIAIVSWVKLTPYFRLDRNIDGDQMRNFPKGTIDVLALGSSHIQYAFNPGVLYARTGYYGYVFGSVCQPFSESYYLLEEVLKTQHPEVVVVDVFTLLPQSQVCYADGTYYIAMDMMSGETRYAASNGIPADVDEETVLGYTYDLYMNHDNWKSMDLSQFEEIVKNGSPDDGIAWGLGYVDQEPEVIQYTPLEVYEPETVVELSEREKYWIDRFQQLCEEEQIHLIFVKTPYQEDQADADKLAGIWKYLKEKKIEYIDFLDLAEELEWFLDMDGDTWHNNTWGAEIVTNYLSDYIESRKYVRSHQKNEDVERVYIEASHRTAKYLLDYKNENIYRLMDEASLYPCMILFRYQGEATSSIGEYEAEALNKLGLSHDFLEDKEEDYYAIVVDGVNIKDDSEPFETIINGKTITFTKEDILIDGASTGQLGEMQIIFLDEDWEWINPIAIDYASGWFWKKS